MTSRHRPFSDAAAASVGEAGYNLVVLMVLVTVLNVLLAAAVPAWSHLVRRDKEEELVFRGMQYAEAIRVFQQRHGRLPVKLEELIEVEPRSIRQLFPEPMSEHGKWGLLVQAQPGQAAPAPGSAGSGQPPAPPPPNLASGVPPAPGAVAGVGFPGMNRGAGSFVAVPPSTEDRFGRPLQQTAGPVVGVYSVAQGESLRTFFGRQTYREWQFHIGLVPTPVILGGESPVPRVHSGWVGKPFREDLTTGGPQAGSGPAPGQELTSPDRRRERLKRSPRGTRPGSN